MAYTVQFTKGAERQLFRLPRAVQPRIVERAEGLADDPRPRGVKKLSAQEDIYRVRVGEYRIVYEIRDRTLSIVVVKVGRRDRVYQ